MEGKVTYLLVEDDDSQACILAKWLKRVALPVQIDVLIEDNLEDGINTSKRLCPNATFLDLLIPLYKNGPVIAEDEWKRVADSIRQFVPPVIITTGKPVETELKLYCMAKGAIHVFHKPFDAGFFATLKQESKLFAAQLLSAAGDAEIRATFREQHSHEQP